MITKFKKFQKLNENQISGYNDGDIVYILFKIPGTDKREIIPVRLSNNGTNGWKFYFDVDGNPIPHQEPIAANKNMIINKADRQDELEAPYKPSWTQEQPVSTDYNPADSGNQMSNDFVLPNS